MDRHMAHQKSHGADLSEPKAQPVRELDDREHGHWGILRGDQPARDRDDGLRYDGSRIYPPNAALWG